MWQLVSKPCISFWLSVSFIFSMTSDFANDQVSSFWRNPKKLIWLLGRSRLICAPSSPLIKSIPSNCEALDLQVETFWRFFRSHSCSHIAKALAQEHGLGLKKARRLVFFHPFPSISFERLWSCLFLSETLLQLLQKRAAHKTWGSLHHKQD